MNAEDIGRRAKEIREAEERAMFGTPEPVEPASEDSVIEALLAAQNAIRDALEDGA